jgi:glutathione S-transferase
LALRRMVEEHSYFALLWLRWIDDAGWALTAPAFFGQLPWPLRLVVPALVRRQVRRDLWGQGMGRHSSDEICRRVSADLDALAAALGPRPYFGGDEPSALDATTYAFIANLIWAPLDTPARQAALASAALVAYAERMRARVGAAPDPAR